ncbi:MAG: cytidyltransferase [Sphingobacteriales bacterium]|nr:MAG: cytidyltransferase [Sphingobacteriales bacterium]
MRRGLILGKFHPLHIGHIALIKLGLSQCDELTVLVCASDKEKIPGEIRTEWIAKTFEESAKIKPLLYKYCEDKLPNTSVSSIAVSRIWADEIKQILPGLNVIFSSEKYGDYLANFLSCEHVGYNLERKLPKLAASEIFKNPFLYWNDLAPAAKPYFVKKICIYGTESTGKSTLAQKLASYYNTVFVPETAREIMDTTDNCTEHHLQEIARRHAKEIGKMTLIANRFLFVDTDINITRSYSRFLFKQVLEIEPWIEQANTFDLYLYLDNKVQHVQDGTRLDEIRRNELDLFHREELETKGLLFHKISGNWEERFTNSLEIIDSLFL